MNRKLVSLAGVFLLLAVTVGLAQEPEAPPAASLPAASDTDINCSGFISGTPLSKDLYIFDGADNDFRGYYRMFKPGEFVFLRSRSGANLAVGSEYSVVRSANELMRIKWYAGQGASIRSLGRAYEDLGRVRVARLTPHGAIAEVTSACGPILVDDFVVPYQARAIPQYTPAAPLDRFLLPNGKLAGAITAGVDNTAFFGVGSRAYINLGTSDGVSAGQRFRVFHIIRDTMNTGYRIIPEPPREIIGEMVVLTTQEKSSVAIVTISLREIYLGDGIEAE